MTGIALTACAYPGIGPCSFAMDMTRWFFPEDRRMMTHLGHVPRTWFIGCLLPLHTALEELSESPKSWAQITGRR